MQCFKCYFQKESALYCYRWLASLFFEWKVFFKKKFDGDVFDVAILKAHPIYKYGKPILLGL